MADIPENVWASIKEVVFHALDGKYQDAAGLRETIDIAVRETQQGMTTASERSPLFRDAFNQVLVLRRICECWRKETLPIDLETLYVSVLGLNGPVRFRTAEFVEDYEGVPPTSLTQIPARLIAINNLLARVDRLRR